MSASAWPDALQPSDSARVSHLLADFWRELSLLPDLLGRGEQLLCARCTSRLRDTVLELMLALNGIAFPSATLHLNTYLGPSQRAAIEKTLIAPNADGDAWIGQAVALVVIYRERSGADAEAGLRWIEEMGTRNRYVLDVWAGG